MAKTRNDRRTTLHRLFRETGAEHPDELTTGRITQWAARPDLANNTVRSHLSVVITFLNWCAEHDELPPAAVATMVRQLRKIGLRYPRTYGRVQASTPARWLSKAEAFSDLLTACADGTWIGSRDQLAIRLGLLGARGAEIVAMDWRNVQPDGQIIRWIGKAHRVRTANPGPTFCSYLERWRREYERQLGRPIRGDDPLLVATKVGRRHGHPMSCDWNRRMSWKTLRALVGRRADLAALGSLAPHDLRRTAAGILHNERSADGGHLYDLLDIQQVLDHASSDTTQRSYIAPISQPVKEAAGRTLD